MNAQRRWRHELGDGTTVHVEMTDRSHGDLGIDADPDGLLVRRRAVIELPWTTLRQVHSRGVIEVEVPGVGAGREGDAVVAWCRGAAVAVQVADCAPVALVHEQGGIAAVHAGWRGLAEGVVEAALETLQGRGGGRVDAVVGACIHAECYRFGRSDLDRLVERWGPGVEARTSAGEPALDLPAAVDGELARLGVAVRARLGGCTACEGGGRRWWSHRARADTARQAMVVWRT